MVSTKVLVDSFGSSFRSQTTLPRPAFQILLPSNPKELASSPTPLPSLWLGLNPLQAQPTLKWKGSSASGSLLLLLVVLLLLLFSSFRDKTTTSKYHFESFSSLVSLNIEYGRLAEHRTVSIILTTLPLRNKWLLPCWLRALMISFWFLRTALPSETHSKERTSTIRQSRPVLCMSDSNSWICFEVICWVTRGCLTITLKISSTSELWLRRLSKTLSLPVFAK